MATSGGQPDGGGVSFPDFTGSGSPEGAQTASVGKSYVDDTNGALYFKRSGSGNTGWVVGSVVPNATGGALAGVGIGDAQGVLYISTPTSGGNIYIGDTDGLNGTGNALQWAPHGADGLQALALTLGSFGQFSWGWTATGETVMPGPITTKPTDSDTATTAYGQVAAGTPLRNTTGYDLLVAGTINVTAATAGTLSLGVGAGATPTTDPIVTALTVAALTFVPFSAVVPDQYYLSIVAGGTITVATITSVATPL